LFRLIEPTVDGTFDRHDPQDYGCVLSLAQHHGYPTPLLDWSDSPFVAAFFAFSTIPKTRAPNEGYVRVYDLDIQDWRFASVRSMADVEPKFARLELRARHNLRVFPQQSVHMFSNLVDIEHHVSEIEKREGRKYLTRIDIPVTERSLAMQELHIMGITAASLFPGVEGLCRSLAEQWF
jgi:hypothetical protein